MKISEVSAQYDLTADTLRYYERIGLIPPINRNDGGIREYTELDIRRVEFVKCMRNAGLPIEVLIVFFKLVEQGDDTIQDRKYILIKERERLVRKIEEMQETLDLLDYKIEVYEERVLKAENKIIESEH